VCAKEYPKSWRFCSAALEHETTQSVTILTKYSLGSARPRVLIVFSRPSHAHTKNKTTGKLLIESSHLNSLSLAFCRQTNYYQPMAIVGTMNMHSDSHNASCRSPGGSRKRNLRVVATSISEDEKMLGLLGGEGSSSSSSSLVCPSRVVRSACELCVFSKLSESETGRLTSRDLRRAVGAAGGVIHRSAFQGLLDALVSLELLERQERQDGEALYSNSKETEIFLVRDQETYIGKVLMTCLGRIQQPHAATSTNVRLMKSICSTGANALTARAKRTGIIDAKLDAALSPQRILDLAFDLRF